MRRELGFLKIAEYSKPFRNVRGHTSELNLTKEEIDEEVGHESGVYIIVSADNTKFVYPKGKSSVIYIGEAKDLHRRLLEHLKYLNCMLDEKSYMRSRTWQPCSRYQYMKYYGAYVYTFRCYKTQESKDLESDILWKFYEKYRSLPVGNGARSFKRVDDE